uniref:G_PROTEIN_RECEP_F1_2 domain-containing protein n=1 Tax=Macrostomum lignano TaxID=282301 RepID=A0A1I8IVR5_9PLAT
MSLASFEVPMFDEHAAFRAAKWIQWVGSPILLLIGSVANSLSAWILTRRIDKNGTHNYLLALSAADQVTLISGLLKSWISALIGDDCAKLSIVICIGGNFLSTSSTYLSVYLIAAVTIERLFVLYSRMPVLNTAVARARRIILGLFIGCLIINIHWFFVLDIYSFLWHPDSNRTHTICYLRPSLLVHLKQPLAWLDFLLYSLIPILLIVVCNVVIIYRICSSRRRYNREMQAATELQDMQSRVRRLVRNNSFNRSVNQVTVMLLLVSCFFIVTSLPITVLKVLSSLSSVIDSTANNNREFYSRYQLIQACAELLMYLNHSSNFFFYCLAAKKFRNDLYSRLRSLRHHCRHSSSGMPSARRISARLSAGKLLVEEPGPKETDCRLLAVLLLLSHEASSAPVDLANGMSAKLVGSAAPLSSTAGWSAELLGLTPLGQPPSLTFAIRDRGQIAGRSRHQRRQLRQRSLFFSPTPFRRLPLVSRGGIFTAVDRVLGGRGGGLVLQRAIGSRGKRQQRDRRLRANTALLLLLLLLLARRTSQSWAGDRPGCWESASSGSGWSSLTPEEKASDFPGESALAAAAATTWSSVGRPTGRHSIVGSRSRRRHRERRRRAEQEYQHECQVAAADEQHMEEAGAVQVAMTVSSSDYYGILQSRGPPRQEGGGVGKEDYAKWRDAFHAYFRRNFDEDPPESPDPVSDSDDEPGAASDSDDSFEEDLRHADPSRFRSFEEFAKWRHNRSQPGKGPDGAKSFRFWFGEEEPNKAGKNFRQRSTNDAFVKCKFCHSMMNVEELVSHEPSCEHKPKPKPPSAPWTADTDAAEEAAWRQQHQFGGSADSRGWRDWRDAHASTQSSIRRDRMRMAAAGAGGAPSFHQFGSTGFGDDFDDEDECCGELALFRCPVCLRTFVRRQISDHVTRCRQSQSRYHGNETAGARRASQNREHPARQSQRRSSSKLPDIAAGAPGATAAAGNCGGSQQRRAAGNAQQKQQSTGGRRGSVPAQQQESKLK